MKGTITKIDPLKNSRNKEGYIRVHFKMEDGSWAITDLVPSYRNYGRWKNLLRKGTDLSGLMMKSKMKVDADSFPVIFKGAGGGGRFVEQPDGSMMFFKETIVEQDEEKLEKGNLTQEKLLK